MIKGCGKEPSVVLYALSGKIAITVFDKMSVVNCQAVKSSQVIGNGKAPKYILLGVEGINFWGENPNVQRTVRAAAYH